MKKYFSKLILIVSFLVIVSCDKQETVSEKNMLNYCDRFTGHPGIEVLVIAENPKIQLEALGIFTNILKEKGFKVLNTKDVYGERTEYLPIPNSNAVFISEVSQESGNIGLVASTLQAVSIIETHQKRSFLSVWDSVNAFSYEESNFADQSLDKIKEDFSFLIEQIVRCQPDECQRPIFYL